MPSRDPLIQLNMPRDLIARIDDYRFANRFASRAAAIKDLIAKALDASTNREPDSRTTQPG